MHAQLQPAAAAPQVAAALPLRITAWAMDHPGLMQSVSHLLASLDVNIESAETSLSSAPHTGTPLFTMQLLVSVPATTQVSRVARGARPAVRRAQHRLEPGAALSSARRRVVTRPPGHGAPRPRGSQSPASSRATSSVANAGHGTRVAAPPGGDVLARLPDLADHRRRHAGGARGRAMRASASPGSQHTSRLPEAMSPSGSAPSSAHTRAVCGSTGTAS